MSIPQSPPLDPILNHLNPLHFLSPDFSTVSFNIILLSMSISLKWSYFPTPGSNSVCVFSSCPCVLRVPPIYQPSWRKVHIMKLYQSSNYFPSHTLPRAVNPWEAMFHTHTKSSLPTRTVNCWCQNRQYISVGGTTERNPEAVSWGYFNPSSWWQSPLV